MYPPPFFFFSFSVFIQTWCFPTTLPPPPASHFPPAQLAQLPQKTVTIPASSMPKATPPSNNVSELFQVLFNQQGKKNILTSTPGSQTQRHQLTKQDKDRFNLKISKMAFLPSELIVNTWFPQRQEQSIREKLNSNSNNLRLGQEGFILRKKYAWEEYLAWLDSNLAARESTAYNYSQVQGKYCGGAVRNKTRKHTWHSSKEIWTGLLKIEVANEWVARHTDLNHHAWKSGEHSLMSVEDPGGPPSVVAQCYWEV